VKTVTTISSLREHLKDWRQCGQTIALVPTMGNLHPGHLSLVELARTLAERVVVSLFVNPTQFGPGEDYESYPRTLDGDQRQLMRAGVDVLFAPSVAEMYPLGQQDSTVVAVPGLNRILCGQFRPGHFDGVSSVVTRLFAIVQPDSAVFGQKDYQQLSIIRRLQADLHLPIRIVAAATQREADGLALSSRNQYLDASGRASAPAIYRSLLACREQLAAGARDFARLEAEGHATLVAAGLRPDYFAVRRAADLGEPAVTDRHLAVLAAAHVGRARLIDNILVDL